MADAKTETPQDLLYVYGECGPNVTEAEFNGTNHDITSSPSLFTSRPTQTGMTTSMCQP